MQSQEILALLRKNSKPKNREGMARFGIDVRTALGVPLPFLHSVAKKAGKSHSLAAQLWASDIHEARLLACLVDEPALVTPKQMDSWTEDFTSWDLCDVCCANLFDKTPYAYDKTVAWSKRKEEFVKRASFALMAALAVHDKKSPDSSFENFLPMIERESTDDRNFVRKAVNWALRQIGKRNLRLNAKATACALRIRKKNSKAAKWIAADALRELQSAPVLTRLKSKEARSQL